MKKRIYMYINDLYNKHGEIHYTNKIKSTRSEN